ncbi:MAG: DUF2491 family protein [Candidatus Latescibacteria bacterium]|nr:DUF2491 family protein [Candidatus Latescibacterota bacterium]
MSYNIIRAVAKKKTSDVVGLFKRKKKRVDENLPLKVKIGGLIELDEPALLAYHGLIQFEFPRFPAVVETVGKIDLGGNVFAHRCYLEKAESFLQIVTENDVVAECRLYVLDREIYPSSDADWDLWIDPETGIVGSPDVLHGEPEELLYSREWVDGEYQADPVHIRERFLKDPFGEDVVVEEQQAMSYFRVASGNPEDEEDPQRVDEFLLISVGDGVVELYLGVDLLESEITVI